MVDPKLLEFCESEIQTKTISAVIECGSNSKAATILRRDRRCVDKVVNRVKNNAAKRGYSPDNDMRHTSPSTHLVKGVSTLYDEDGNVKSQWVKTDLQKQNELQSIETAIQEYSEELTGKAPKIPKPKTNNADLLVSYNVGDAHFGMYAWHEETGKDFDTDIASRELKEAFGRLVAMAPPAETALILELGDFMHYDNESQTTSRSGNSLDGDTRLERVFKCALDAMNHLVSLTLQKHKKVLVRCVRGNHNDVTSIGIKYALWAFWKDERRVTIELSPALMWFHEFGQNLIMATHGDKCKPSNFGAIMAHDQREAWGRTKYHYAWHGHFHSKAVIDLPGCRVEGFTNLAPNDAWHHDQGYRSPQEITMVMIDKNRGEVGRVIERPE